MTNTLLTIFLFGCDVIFVEFLSLAGVSNFYTRKVGHILGALICFWMISVLTQSQFVFVCILLILVNLASKFLSLINSIEKAHQDSWGTILFPIAILVVGLLFWNHSIVYKGGILILGFADSLGAIIGKTFGSYRVFNNSKKTWEGCIAFALVSSIILSSTIYLHTKSFSLTQFVQVIFASIFLSFIEVISPKGSDNLSITVLSSLFLYFILV